MIDRLPGGGTAIEYRAVPLIQLLIGRKLPGDDEQVPHEHLVGLGQVIEARDRPARNDENMCRCLRIYVTKRNALIVLVNHIGRHFAVRNLLKKRSAFSHEYT